MEDALRLLNMAGEAGEQQAQWGVVEDHSAFPCEGTPAAQLPSETFQPVGFVVGLLAAIDEVVLYLVNKGDIETVRLQDCETLRHRDTEALGGAGVEDCDELGHSVVFYGFVH